MTVAQNELLQQHDSERGEDLSLEDLALLVQAGDTEAFTAIYEQLHTKVYEYILRRVGNTHDAEDRTQVTFENAFKGIRTFKGGTLQGWIYTIARNTIINWHRYTKARPTEILGDDTFFFMPAENRESSALEDAAAVEEILAFIRESSDADTFDDLELKKILLMYANELSGEEIAANLGLNSRDTVRSRMFRLRKRLSDAGITASNAIEHATLDA